MNQPWECPRCNRINAPWMSFCLCLPNANCLWCGSSMDGKRCVKCYMDIAAGVPKTQCDVCGQPHAGYTCEEWVTR